MSIHLFFFFFFNDPPTTEIYTLSLHDALPISPAGALIARLQAQGVPVLVGTGQQLKVEVPGHLFLGVNISGTPPCNGRDRKSTRLNSSHSSISYAVFCLKKKKNNNKT